VPKIAVWAMSSPSYYKVNYDTTIRQDFSAQAAVCRNSRGTIIDSYQASLFSSFWRNHSSSSSLSFGFIFGFSAFHLGM